MIGSNAWHARWLKLRSFATLFACVAPPESIDRDGRTLQLLGVARDRRLDQECYLSLTDP